jgi:hypothetical protein
MSILKIQRDIELIERQLEKIELEISDPIERIEQKKQLERKINKLKQSKSQIEKLEQEQQELALLKSEFTLDNNDSLGTKESKQQKHTVPVNDTFIVIESKTNIKEQVQDNWNNQVNNIDLDQRSLDTTSSITPQANNSKEFGKAWIIGCTIGFFIFLGLVINGNKASQIVIEQKTSEPEPINTEQSFESLPSTETEQQVNLFQGETENISQSIPSYTQEEAVDLLARWQSAKRQIFAPPFDRELGSELLTGKAYYDNVGNPEGSVAWLQNNASYYTYGVQSIDSVENFAVDENYATIEVIVTEQRTLYNQHGNIDQNASGFDTRLVRYNLESENGQWKIADYQTIEKIK